MRQRISQLSVLTWLLVLAPASGCGGSTPGASSPTSEGDTEEYVGTEGGSDGLPECADGTCFACGEGLCPQGFYCDDSAPGGPGCSWLPECARDASCGCLESALGECSCEDRDGGVHVSCS